VKCGVTIKSIRDENELNMEDFGIMIGVTKGYISLLERDMRQPSIKLLTEIEKLFSVVLLLTYRDKKLHDRE
tara:strand:- start:2987 stop:3202 length:216 start_codon:yes stop_codon:yes gene_type:complete